MIAIPDYVSGATEHWGLITYRETSFLIDEATASVYNKINVANTIAHELAHMWFGNLGKQRILFSRNTFLFYVHSTILKIYIFN